jgi:hypothetical protein
VDETGICSWKLENPIDVRFWADDGQTGSYPPEEKWPNSGKGLILIGCMERRIFNPQLNPQVV